MATPAKSRTPHLHNACISCKGRKIRCSGERPCHSCAKHGRECVYQELRTRGRKRKDASNNLTPNPPTFRALAGPLAAKRVERLRAGVSICQPHTGAIQFYGSASNISFLYAFYQRIHRNVEGSDSDDAFRAMQAWGFDKFLFPLEPGILQHINNSLPFCLPRDQGDSFIKTFFCACHPQFPFLVRDDIEQHWARMWEPPTMESDVCFGSTLTARNIVLMVLAIGASMSGLSPERDAKAMEQWSSYLASRVQLSGFAFADASLGGVHLLFLRSIFGVQQMRLNEAHLFASHAAANALALGMNRAHVANGPRPEMHRLRVTFWSLYSHERLLALYYGRPSCFRDDSIDVALPEDLPASDDDETTDMAYIRTMAALAKVADRINIGIYSATGSDAATIERVACECDTELDRAMRLLPSFLHFFDANVQSNPHAWQEIQRTHLGLAYYHCRILMYQPLTCLATMHHTHEEALAEASALGIIDLQHSIAQAMSAAGSLIKLALEAFTTRIPALHQDSGVAYDVLNASLVLLYRLLDGPARISNSDATSIFNNVQDGIRCLDFMDHHGPKFGKKTLSERILSVAKDAFRSAREEVIETSTQLGSDDHGIESADSALDLDPNLLLTQFPWLDTITPSVHSTDMSPTALSSNNAEVAFDAMSSRDLYTILFSAAPPAPGVSVPAMPDSGTYPWPTPSNGKLGGPSRGSEWY